jgi:signal transduction histidine kinase
MSQPRRRSGRRESLLYTYGAQFARLTEQSRAELALVAAKEQAEAAAEQSRAAMIEAQEADRAKTEFLAHMSHELRTPLNAIIGFSDMIQKDLLGAGAGAGGSAKKYDEYARHINESGHHLLRLINDILDLARIQAGQLVLHDSDFDIGLVARACLAVVEPMAEKGEVQLSCDAAAGTLVVCADEHKLRRAIINLLSNAIKFTPPSGRASVSVRHAADGTARISISDSGIGIAPEDISRALTPFQQIDSPFSRKYEGSGLGLPITKALVELHGGRMTIDSEPAKGTTVTLILPAARVRHVKEATAAPSPAADLAKDALR